MPVTHDQVAGELKLSACRRATTYMDLLLEGGAVGLHGGDLRRQRRVVLLQLRHAAGQLAQRGAGLGAHPPGARPVEFPPGERSTADQQPCIHADAATLMSHKLLCRPEHLHVYHSTSSPNPDNESRPETAMNIGSRTV